MDRNLCYSYSHSAGNGKILAYQWLATAKPQTCRLWAFVSYKLLIILRILINIFTLPTIDISNVITLNAWKITIFIVKFIFLPIYTKPYWLKMGFRFIPTLWLKISIKIYIFHTKILVSISKNLLFLRNKFVDQ